MSRTIRVMGRKNYKTRSFLKTKAFWGLLLTVFLVGACASTSNYPPGGERSVSIPYDPYNFDPQRLDEEAQAHCDAYNLQAVYEDETIDNQSVRWRYRHYVCL